MKPDAALVGTDGTVELDAETAVYLNLSCIVRPGHAEDDLPFRLHHAFDNPQRDVLRVFFQDTDQRFQHFLHCLVKLRLMWIAVDDTRV